MPPGSPNPDPFSDLASKKLCHHYLKQKKRFLKIHFELAYYFSLSFSLIWNLSNEVGSYCSRSTFKTHTRFQTKWVKSIPVFIFSELKAHHKSNNFSSRQNWPDFNTFATETCAWCQCETRKLRNNWKQRSKQIQ